MESRKAVLEEITLRLEEQDVPYMLIGGIANLVWGRPRLTRDLDIVVMCPQAGIPVFLQRMNRFFRLMPRDPLSFVQETSVLPLIAGDGTPIDLMFARLPYEETAIGRAVDMVLHGVRVKVCTAEDLIIHKVISERAIDREDVKGIIATRGTSLDRDYLDPIVRELSGFLDRPEIWTYYLECCAEIQPRPAGP